MLKRNPRDPGYGEDEMAEADYTAPDIYQRQPNDDATQPRTEGRPSARAESVIDSQSTFEGRFVAEGDLRIEGTISGEVVCRGLLTIEKEAEAKAKVEARDARILGRLDGEVTCSGRLELAPTAVVKGTLRAAVLVVQEGASLSGNIETKAMATARPEIRAVPASASADDEPEAAPEPAAAASAPESTPARNGRPRAVPSFALSPSDSERPTRERN